jgi:transcriptional regulator GlxA family with amidase domain
VSLASIKTRWADAQSQNSFEDAPQFDIIVIPGSYSRGELLASTSAFLTEQTSNPNFIAIMCISSGILTLVQSGVLNQKRATAPSFLLPALRQQFPESLWQETAWTRQDSIWSSSSAVTAIAMMTAFIREYFWDRAEAVECALSAAGIAPLNDYE